jgi:hypothetical protein
MELSGQLLAPAALSPEKEPLVPIGWEAGWAPEPVWTRWWREKFPAPAGSRTPTHPSYSPVLHHWAMQVIDKNYCDVISNEVSYTAVMCWRFWQHFVGYSVGIALGYGLDDRGSRVRFPARAGNFSLYHRVQNGSGAHPASYPMGTRGSFPGGKSAGAWS